MMVLMDRFYFGHIVIESISQLSFEEISGYDMKLKDLKRF